MTFIDGFWFQVGRVFGDAALIVGFIMAVFIASVAAERSRGRKEQRLKKESKVSDELTK